MPTLHPRSNTLFPRFYFLTAALSCALFLGFWLSACGPDDIFHEKKDVSAAGWAHSDSLTFSFDIQDTSLLYNLYLLADYDAEVYAFQNLYLKINTRFPDGRNIEVVRSFDLFAPDGQKNGSGSKSKSSLRTFLQENAYFNLVGSYTVTMQQHTRTLKLPGLHAIGFEVERTKQKRK